MVQGSLSQSLNLDFGVLQGACLGPLFFTTLCKQIVWIKVHLPMVHCYAYDMQLYVSFSPNKSTGQFEAVTAIQHCVDDIRNWMTNDKLFLNDDKTEFLMIGTKQQLVKVNIDHILIGDSVIRSKGVELGNIFLGGPLRCSFTHLSQVASTIVRACSMACQPTSLISYRGSKMLPLS